MTPDKFLTENTTRHLTTLSRIVKQMIAPGAKVRLSIPHLYYANQNVRIDSSVSAVTGTSVPEGASGEIIEVKADEVKVRLYWNLQNIPGAGNDVILWIKKVIFGNSFEYI